MKKEKIIIMGCSDFLRKTKKLMSKFPSVALELNELQIIIICQIEATAELFPTPKTPKSAPEHPKGGLRGVKI